MTSSDSQIALPLTPDSTADTTVPLTALAADTTDATNVAADEATSAAMTAPATIELKGISLPVMHVSLNRLEPENINAALHARFGKNASRFFDNDPALLDLSRLVLEPEVADWAGIRAELAGASLQLIGIYGGSEVLQDSARAAGLAVIEATSVPVPKKAAEPVIEVAEETKETETKEAETVSPAAEAAPAENSAPQVEQAAAMVIDKPLRSGQRIYARGGDLVVLAMVSAGAEVIADGNIHIYAPLRGRALAGASGDINARIFTTSFEAELVSIAGVYRTFESPQQFGKLGQQPVQVSLVTNPDKPDSEPTLQVNSLSTR